MHKINKPEINNEIEQYINKFKIEHPFSLNQSQGDRWSQFTRNEQKYYKIIDLLSDNQDHLCAYCEKKIRKNDRQLEHFFPKSLSSDKHDYTIDFNNFLISCKGGENDKLLYINESYLSCGPKKANTNPINNCISPYGLPDFSIFKLELELEDKKVKLVPDEDECRKAQIELELVTNTINHLGLNCDRLAKLRYAIHKTFSQNCRNDINFIENIDKAIKNKQNKRPAFYTTILLIVKGFFNNLDFI
jgi:uncharacterized protein (TIGR02646 family)